GGIKAGDVIIRVDDKRVAGPREVTSYLRSSQSKRTFSFTVVREKREMTLSVTLDDNSRGDSGRGARWMESFNL
ncbi:MAG: PDZ domain-containing protein, partial [Bryobacteraceae bacterium]